MSRNRVGMVRAVWIGGLFLAAAVWAADLTGSWPGTWEGGGAGGKFDITFSKGANGAIAGKVDVGQDAGDYSANFKTVSLEGNKLKARYDYPPENAGEIVLEGAFDGAKGTGTWNLVAPGGNEAFATGTWTVAKK